MLSGTEARLDFEKITTAAEITLAFHAKINIPPAPKIIEKMRANIKTYRLLVNIPPNN